MLRGLAWLFVSLVSAERQIQKGSAEKSRVMGQEDRARLLSQIALAGEIIAPFWPMRTFNYRNPLRGLEHLPFDEAVRRARGVLGGEGYLPNETYRQFYQRGRITREEVGRALLRLEPALTTRAPIRTVARTIEPVQVLSLHLIYGFHPLSPEMSHLLPKQGSAPFREDLSSELRKGLLEQATRDRQGGVQALSDRHETDPEHSYGASLWSAVLEKVEDLEAFRREGSGGRLDPSSALSAAARDLPASKNGAPPPWSEVFEGDFPQIGKERTLGEWGGKLSGRDLVEEINDQMIKWCAAFLSEGAAAWPMPHRDRGFYGAWRALAIYDFSGQFTEIGNVRARINQLPAQPEEAILSHLTRMGIPEAHWKAYFERHLAQLPGWTGFIKWRSDNRDYSWQKRYPIDLAQYLAVRLFYEAEFLDHLCRENWRIGGSLPAMAAYFRGHPEEYYVRKYAEEVMVRDDRADSSRRDWGGLARRIHRERTEREAVAGDPIFRDGWRLFHLSQFLNLSTEEVLRLAPSEIQSLLSLLDALPPERQGPVWQEAYEAHYRRRLIDQLSDGLGKRAASRSLENGSATGIGIGRAVGREDPPRAQAVFCIDARQEPLRRHLEERGLETYGFAGFFGVPIRFRPFHSEEELDLCPVLIKPKHAVTEHPRPTERKVVERNLSGSRWHHIVDGLYHDLKMNLLSPYIIVEIVGMLFGLPFIGRTLFPRFYQKVKAYFRRRLMPPVSTVMEMNLAPAEQAYFVEAALRLMGLTKTFARLVLVCAHGSRSENNPYFAALDCGACGGNHGGPNARVFAAMANRPEVRRLLRERGIFIPEETVFIAGEHNTTTDEVTLFDREDLPPSHRADLDRLVRDLQEGGAALSRERCTRLPGAPHEATPQEAVSHVALRSGDWSQVRPEWGLSGNAGFIIGRRALTQGLNLQGRAFLHSYDPDQDESGKALEIIMTAPLIVGEWINLEYYFSTVDNRVHGSGTKVVHNVVGRIGVMIGNRSDLQTGLPWQTVMDGEEYYHEPMRLLAVIEAPVDRVASIIRRHRVLQHLFDNQWVVLVAVDPATGLFRRYGGEGRWEVMAANRPAEGSHPQMQEIER